jgi:hydrogenase expression/formation protein HypD
MVTSPLDALELARRRPDTKVVFFAVGFETTAPTTAVAVQQAQAGAVHNFSVLVAHVRVPPALEALLSLPENGIDGLLAAGHVCSVMGTAEYAPLAERFALPIVVTGFEPVDILQGILACTQLMERREHRVANHYARVVPTGGNSVAQALVKDVFDVTDLPWRGLGMIPSGGLGLRPRFADHDASAAFGALEPARACDSRCQSGLVLAGKKRPTDCPAFGTECTPSHPLGAPMVSSEGACAAYFRHAPNRIPVGV